ncbi:MAG TPA: TonB-dependent receptor, partial [Rhodocyclaceae bacterium]|nr:TonB-dependent receptor [Rhodocyclaceae bacterium]
QTSSRNAFFIFTPISCSVLACNKTPPSHLTARRSPSALLAIFFFAACPLARAATDDADLGDLSLEQLTRIKVTSVSRRAEPLATAAASIYVITSDDIRRSGATSLPEALMLAPNLQVARLSGREYAITARGFNSTAANKLLVQLDGRSLYTPLFSGVLWDAQDVVMEDIDRIEVISGPGATLWGSNAVNGVINIITRRAKETQGGLASASTGDLRHEQEVRYGGAVSDNTNYRIYAKRENSEQTNRPNGTGASDAWHKTQAGFRVDMDQAKGGVTIEGDAYDGYIDPAAPEMAHISGSNLLTRWTGQTAGGSSQTVRFYYDGTERHVPGLFEEQLKTFDLLAQQDTKLGIHDFVYGTGYRLSRDHIVNGSAEAFLPTDEDLRWMNVFAQDDVMVSKTTRATVGARAEYNVYSHWEFLPSLRLSQNVSKDSVIWSALSRSVRAPSRIDRDLFAPGNPPFLLAGGPEFTSEVANTAELGFRQQATSLWSYSLTSFYERFRRLRAATISNGKVVFDNGDNGHTYGVEGWTTYRINQAWRVDAGFLRMRKLYSAEPGSALDLNTIGDDPKYQWQVRTTVDATSKLDFAVSVRHVSALPNPAVPSFTEVDLHSSYKISPKLTASLSILNAQGGSHQEMITSSTVGSEFSREIYVALTAGF